MRKLNNEQVLQLINLLPTEGYLTSESISQLCKVSSRTVRKRIKEVGSIIEKNGGEIVAKPGSGFCLKINDKKRFLDFKKSIHSQKSLLPNSKEERIQYLLDYLLLTQEKYIKIDDLAKQLFVSRTIITDDLKTVREKLSRYHIRVINTPKYGINIEGKEFNLRLCIANNVSTNLLNYDDENENVQYELSEISSILVNLLEENSFYLSGMAYQNLVIHIYLMLKRAEIKTAGTVLNKQTMEMVRKSYSKEVRLAKTVLLKLEETFRSEIDLSEAYYIAIHLAGKKVIELDKVAEQNLVIPDDVNEIVRNMLKIVNDYFQIDFRDDLELRMSLALHLIPMKTRIDFNLNIKNPLLKEIKTRFTLAYTIAIQACSVFESKYSILINEAEIGYFALHFNLALERKKKVTDLKNVLIVCSSGKGTAKLLAYRCQSEFERYLDKVETCDVFQLKKIDLNRFDYIFTTVPINFPIPIPILEIKYFLEGEDIEDAKKLFVQNSIDNVLKYFDENLFFKNLNFDTKEEVLHYIVTKIEEYKDIPSKFYQSVMRREKQAVTEFGNLVALPHPNKAMTEDTFVTIAILDKPILWDKQKVQFVCLMSIEKNVDKDLQLFYKVISRFLISRKDVQSVIKEKDFFHLLSTLKKVEGNLTEI